MAPFLDDTTRAIIVALKSPLIGRSTKEIHALIPTASLVVINRTYKRAIERGFDPSSSTLLVTTPMVADAPRTG
jgi:mannose-1-phosphate guanylyltransferase